tara:strand:- start:33 stop:470 length:438 start_codon:yes stop_codon:yes gene_type:complete
MGTELATDLVNNNHQDAEQKLWRHVILNALEDASVDLNDRKSAVNKFEAHNWIIRGEDFEKISWWAGWDPELVRQQYKKAIKNMTIKFTYKQVKWQKYYVLYKKLQITKNTEARLILRRLVENARKQVYNASVSNVKNFCQLKIR